MGLRDLLKAGVERGLVASGVPRRRIGGGASDVVILSYHNVVPSGEKAGGDLSLHLGQARFGDQLDRLVETHDVVSLGSLAVGEPEGARPRAVVTFDDAYRGAVTAGFDELRRRGLPATVFVPPGLLGTEGFWWDRLADGEGLPDDLRRPALERLGGRQDRILSWARDEGRAPTVVPEHARPATQDELLAAVATGGFELGSHTWGHVNLAGIPEAEARDEMSRGHRWLEDLPPSVPVVDWLAYPYGLRTPAVVRAVEGVAGHAVRVEGGAAVRAGRWTASAHDLPRVNVPAGLTPDGLTLRLAGLR